MRTGKRVLAGVAAGALTLGFLAVAGAPSVSAAKSIKPKALKTATVTAVRATGTSSPLSIPEAKMSWTGAGSFTNSSGLNVLKLTTAPTATAILTVDDSTGTGDDTATLGQTATAINFTSTVDDSSVRFNVDTAGTYVGSIANGTDTVSFSFATAGAPTSMTLTPATQTVLVGATADVTISLKDAAGNTTQPQTVDSVTLASSGDDTIGTTPLTGAKGGALQYGTFDDTVLTQTAGTSTLTATPLGTLPGTGVTARTASLVKSGTVSNVPVIGIGVTTPANAVNGGTNPTARTSFVPEGTTTLVVTVDDTTGKPAGNALRFKAALVGAGTVNGVNTLVDDLYIDVTTNASKKATISLTVGGAGVIAGSELTLTQVNVADVTVASGGVDVINWQTPAVQPANIVPTPTTALAALGASTPITVEVDDSFGGDQAGWTVTAYRGSVSGGNFLSSGVTNSAGSASVTVSPLSTVVNLGTENYVYTAQPPVGAAVTGSTPTTITYTTSGGITSLSVANGAGATVCSNSSCTLATYPTILVPSSGVVSAFASAGIYTVASGTVTTAASTNMMTFTPTTSPVNTVTVTVPEGVKVSNTLPTATTLWSAGAQTASVTSGSPVYVWSTKTATHDITVASGGLSITNKLRVVNRNTDAYNIAVSPATQTLATGGFGTATVTITDVFGNIVAGTTDDSGAVTVAASGEILLGGFTASQKVTTGTAGTGTVTLIAGNTAGAGLLTVTPLSGTLVPAWQTIYTPPVGAPAPKVSAISTVTIGAAPVTKTITITGTRAEVAGKPGIFVDGVTTGIEDGKTVVPYIRFPGQTTFTAGSARPVITADEFIWQRKTGKRVTVYVTNDDGAVTSNRLTIQAA